MSKPIQIYVDADACPVKNEVYRVAERHGLKVFVVSNSFINVPRDPMIERVVVGQGMDEADNWIAERAVPTTFGKVSFDYKLRRFLGAHRLSDGDAHAYWRMIFDPAERTDVLRQLRPQHLAGRLVPFIEAERLVLRDPVELQIAAQDLHRHAHLFGDHLHRLLERVLGEDERHLLVERIRRRRRGCGTARLGGRHRRRPAGARSRQGH